jgi:hypothetical protein
MMVPVVTQDEADQGDAEGGAVLDDRQGFADPGEAQRAAPGPTPQAIRGDQVAPLVTLQAPQDIDLHAGKQH